MDLKIEDFIEPKREIDLGDAEKLLNLKEAREFLGVGRYELEKLLKAHKVHISAPIGHRCRYVVKGDLLKLKEKMTKEMTTKKEKIQPYEYPEKLTVPCTKETKEGIYSLANTMQKNKKMLAYPIYQRSC